MGISIWQLAIIAIIVALLFGTKRLRTLGGDVGSSIKGFKEAMGGDSAKSLKSEIENAVSIDDKDQLSKAQQVEAVTTK